MSADGPDDAQQRSEVKAMLAARLPRFLATVAVTYLVFVAIAMINGHHSVGAALLGALVFEAVLIVAIGGFVGAIVFLMFRTRRRR